MEKGITCRGLLGGLVSAAGLTAVAACTGAPASPTTAPAPAPTTAPAPTVTQAPASAPKPTEAPQRSAAAQPTAASAPAATPGIWIAGDFHTHTFLTDGKHVQAEVVSNAFEKYGLSWMANSEPGGSGSGLGTDGQWWDDLIKSKPIKIQGDKVTF